MFRKALRARICAAPILMDGEDLRSLPLSMRKANLERLLRGRPDGIFVNPFEIGEIGPDLFRAACGMGLEGLVSKRSDSRPSGWRGKLPGRRRRKASSAVSAGWHGGGVFCGGRRRCLGSPSSDKILGPSEAKRVRNFSRHCVNWGTHASQRISLTCCTVTLWRFPP